MLENLQCWRCGAILRGVIMPMSRREECAACAADLHSCKMCKQYQPGLSDSCSEDRSESVTDKERANFCDYFSPAANAFKQSETQAAIDSRRGLAELFGDSPQLSADAETKIQSEAGPALAELEQLFSKSSPDD